VCKDEGTDNKQERTYIITVGTRQQPERVVPLSSLEPPPLAHEREKHRHPMCKICRATMPPSMTQSGDLDSLNKAVKQKLLGYHFRAHPKLDPPHFFQPTIVCKSSNIDVAAVVESFTDNNNEYQLRDFKAVVELTDGLNCNDTNNETRVKKSNKKMY
jgi:hypothetical protein